MTKGLPAGVGLSFKKFPIVVLHDGCGVEGMLAVVWNSLMLVLEKGTRWEELGLYKAVYNEIPLIRSVFGLARKRVERPVTAFCKLTVCVSVLCLQFSPSFRLRHALAAGSSQTTTITANDWELHYDITVSCFVFFFLVYFWIYTYAFSKTLVTLCMVQRWRLSNFYILAVAFFRLTSWF